jgi:hypothetical protein
VEVWSKVFIIWLSPGQATAREGKSYFRGQLCFFCVSKINQFAEPKKT